LEFTMAALRTTLARPQQHLDSVHHTSTIEVVPDISVSVSKHLMRDIEEAAHGDVNAFVVEALKNELYRRHLDTLIQELEEQVGPVDEEQVARFAVMLAKVNRANAAARTSQGEQP
jgi:hypothetical protein